MKYLILRGRLVIKVWLVISFLRDDFRSLRGDFQYFSYPQSLFLYSFSPFYHAMCIVTPTHPGDSPLKLIPVSSFTSLFKLSAMKVR